MTSNSIGDNSFFTELQGLPCPVCGRGPSWKLLKNPLSFEYQIRCDLCHATFTKSELEKFFVERVKTEEIIPKSVDESPANLLIFRFLPFIKDKERIEKTLNDIKKQVQDGVVLLNHDVEFVGAYNYAPNEGVLLLDDVGDPIKIEEDS